MPSKQSYAQPGRNTYIPPHIEQAMTQHMQQSLPAHLRQYIGNDGYIPTSVQSSISASMQKTMPAHMRQYANTYMEHRVINSAIDNHTINTQARQVAARPPVPDSLNRSHSMPYGEQHTVELNSLPLAARNMFSSDQTDGNNTGPTLPTNHQSQVISSDSPSTFQPTYDFILNNDNGPKPSFKLAAPLPGLSSNLGRTLVVIGILFVLVIGYSVLMSAISGQSNVPAILSVLEDQKELIHITTNASQQSLPENSQNFAYTAQISLASNSGQLIKYLAINHDKFKQADLNLKINSATDLELSNSTESGTYSQTFAQVANLQIKTYMSDLSHAYNLTKGPKGRALLKNDYNQANLLLAQLTSTT
jgi:hypothetical protein